MKKTLLLAAMMLNVQSAYALHWFSCSSADQTFRIEEQEVWGANPTTCSFNGEALKDNVVVVDKTPIVELNRVDDAPPRDFKRDFTAIAHFKGVGDDLIAVQ